MPRVKAAAHIPRPSHSGPADDDPVVDDGRKCLARGASTAADPVHEKKAKPELVAMFTINAIPALAVLDRGGTGASDGTAADPWDAICHKPQALMGSAATPRTLVVPLKRRCHRATSDVPVMPPADSRPPQAS